MKRYIKYVSYVLLEGKKQAMQILDDRDIVDQLAMIDPTETNKYVELFAKLYKNSSDPESLMADLRRLSVDIGIAERKGIKIDVGKIKTLNELQSLVQQQATKITKGSAKQGISGLTEGKDYFDFGKIESLNGTTYQGYIPLHWKASRVIASPRVGGCDGKWCTAYQKDESYWIDHVQKQKKIFVYLVAIGTPEKETDKKLACEFNQSGKLLKVWDSGDKNFSPKKYFN